MPIEIRATTSPAADGEEEEVTLEVQVDSVDKTCAPSLTAEQTELAFIGGVKGSAHSSDPYCTCSRSSLTLNSSNGVEGSG